MAFEQYKRRLLGAVNAQPSSIDDVSAVEVYYLWDRKPCDGVGLVLYKDNEVGGQYEAATVEFDFMHALAVHRLFEVGGDWAVMDLIEHPESEPVAESAG